MCDQRRVAGAVLLNGADVPVARLVQRSLVQVTVLEDRSLHLSSVYEVVALVQGGSIKGAVLLDLCLARLSDRAVPLLNTSQVVIPDLLEGSGVVISAAPASALANVPLVELAFLLYRRLVVDTAEAVYPLCNEAGVMYAVLFGKRVVLSATGGNALRGGG